MEPKINAYVCPKCNGLTVTIERVKGVTPMFLGCRANGEVNTCGGFSASMMYRIPPKLGELEPKWEWYSPHPATIQNLDLETQEHVRKDGLLLKKIETELV